MRRRSTAVPRRISRRRTLRERSRVRGEGTASYDTECSRVAIAGDACVAGRLHHRTLRRRTLAPPDACLAGLSRAGGGGAGPDLAVALSSCGFFSRHSYAKLRFAATCRGRRTRGGQFFCDDCISRIYLAAALTHGSLISWQIHLADAFHRPINLISRPFLHRTTRTCLDADSRTLLDLNLFLCSASFRLLSVLI